MSYCVLHCDSCGFKPRRWRIQVYNGDLATSLWSPNWSQFVACQTSGMKYYRLQMFNLEWVDH